MQICGVDEAGRGSLLGPLVVAGVSVKKSAINDLSSIGVKDSKKLLPKTRAEIYKEILKIVDKHYIVRINPRMIDANVKRHNLNNLEAKYMAKIISRLQPDIAYVDSCDVNPTRFGKKISLLSNISKIRSYHHAESKSLVVAAASIIAKVARDKSIARIQKNYHVGSGYPSDSKTIGFVTQYYQENQTFPNFVRTSWAPAKIIVNNVTLI
ncbi:MAG: ribonuclease HII [Nitrosopumilaceae archaeon]|nr:ribonuclease HII [Nitrosopumilaceae archaeon]